MGAGWIFDRILCQAYIRQKPDTVPIQAFHSEAKGIWTNTLQIESMPIPIGNNQWKYDGTPFYAYKTSMNSSLLKPIWRYWNRINYGTEDVSEPRRSYLRMGDTVDDDLPGWRLDRIIFYAFSPHMNVTELNNWNKSNKSKKKKKPGYEVTSVEKIKLVVGYFTPISVCW